MRLVYSHAMYLGTKMEKEKGMKITSVIWRTTSSLLINLPSKRGARSSASIWKKAEGRIVILSLGCSSGSEIGVEFDSHCWAARVSSPSQMGLIPGIDFLGLVATRLNRRVRFILRLCEPNCYPKTTYFGGSYFAVFDSFCVGQRCFCKFVSFN